MAQFGELQAVLYFAAWDTNGSILGDETWRVGGEGAAGGWLQDCKQNSDTVRFKIY